jgi:FkbM family methyltransferase
LLELIRLIPSKAKGIYVDLAAAYPVGLSNTFLLDACLGWAGLCIEGDRQKHPALRNNRGCKLIENCVSNKAETLEFISQESSGTTGIKGFAPDDIDPRWSKENKDKGVHYQLQCFTLDHILRENGVKHVDIMSLDIEGFEGNALEGMMNSDVKIDVVVMEIGNCCVGDEPRTRKAREQVLGFFSSGDYVPMIGLSEGNAGPGKHCPTPYFGRDFNLYAPSLTLETVFKKGSGGWQDVVFIRKDSEYFGAAVNYLQCKKPNFG